LKVETGGKEEYAIVLDSEVIDTFRSRFVPRVFVAALGANGLYYVFSVGSESGDSWSKSGRKMIAAAKEGPISHWTDTRAKRYRYAPATKDLGKLADPQWVFGDLSEYVELAYDEDLLIDSLDHSLVRNFENEALESAAAVEDE
jgi:hypothetical protein